MRRMRPTTRKRLLISSGIAAAVGLYVTLSVAYGDKIHPFHEWAGNAFEDMGLAIGEGFVRSALWITEFDGPQVLVLLGIAWALREIIPVARRNRHKLPSMPAINGRRVGAISGITLVSLAALAGLSFGSVALADHGRPMVKEAYASSEAWVNRNAPWNNEDEPKAAPALPAAPTGNTGTEPTDTASPAPAQPEQETEEPKDTTSAETDKETKAPAETRSDAKDAKSASEKLASHVNQFADDPAQWVKDNPIAATAIFLILVLWMTRALLAWRRNVLMRDEIAYLRNRVGKQNVELTSLKRQIGAADEDGTLLHAIATLDGYVRDDDRRLTALETIRKPRRNSGPDTLVAGGSTD